MEINNATGTPVPQPNPQPAPQPAPQVNPAYTGMKDKIAASSYKAGQDNGKTGMNDFLKKLGLENASESDISELMKKAKQYDQYQLTTRSEQEKRISELEEIIKQSQDESTKYKTEYDKKLQESETNLQNYRNMIVGNAIETNLLKAASNPDHKVKDLDIIKALIFHKGNIEVDIEQIEKADMTQIKSNIPIRFKNTKKPVDFDQLLADYKKIKPDLFYSSNNNAKKIPTFENKIPKGNNNNVKIKTDPRIALHKKAQEQEKRVNDLLKTKR